MIMQSHSRRRMVEKTKSMSADWTPTSLPQEIVDKVNKAIGFVGKPYFILGTPSFENNWAPESVATGCFCWRIQVKMPVPEDFASMEEYVEHVEYPLLNSMPDLEKVRGLLANEAVIVYISADCE